MAMRSQAEEMMDIGKWLVAGFFAFLASIPELTYLLLGLMGLDMLFGLAAAWKRKDVSPTEMWEGVTKKMGSLGIIALAALIDHYIDILGIDLVQVTTVFYIGPEILSILRNAAIAGIPVPPQFASVLRYFQEKEKSENRPLP